MNSQARKRLVSAAKQTYSRPLNTPRHETSMVIPELRSKLVFGLLTLLFILVVARTFWIQGPGNQFYLLQGEKRYQRIVEDPAYRGRVIDRNGYVLAQTIDAYAICATPSRMSWDTLTSNQKHKLSQMLQLDIPTLERKLAASRHFVYLARQVNAKVANDIKELKIKGLFLQREEQRYYPEGPKMAQVIGFTNREDVAKEGIELLYDKEMLGRDGQKKLTLDKLGNVVRVDSLAVPVNGQDVHLTLDKTLQYFAYEAIKSAVDKHKAQSGSAVVVNAQSGEILAMVNYPSYDPNQLLDEGRNIQASQLRNRVMIDEFEPGSVMKPINIALALDNGIVFPETVVDTSGGKKKIGNFVISDAHDFGPLTVGQVIQKSSNVGTVNIIEKLPKKNMWEGIQQFGFGQIPSVAFPGSTAGRLRSYKKWTYVDKLSLSYGYGMRASLFQLAQAYTAFANDGVLMPLNLVKHISYPTDDNDGSETKVIGGIGYAASLHPVSPIGSGADQTRESENDRSERRWSWQKFNPFREHSSMKEPTIKDRSPVNVQQLGVPVISAETARQMRHMLEMVTAPTGGTAPAAQVSGYRVGGKTGTVRKYIDGKYSREKYRDIFVGLAPMSAPKIVVAVMVDEPQGGQYYAGEVVAPIFSQIVEQTLRILEVAVDSPVKSIVVGPAVKESI